MQKRLVQKPTGLVCYWYVAEWRTPLTCGAFWRVLGWWNEISWDAVGPMSNHHAQTPAPTCMIQTYRTFNCPRSKGWLLHGWSSAILTLSSANCSKRSPFKAVHFVIISSLHAIGLPYVDNWELCLQLFLCPSDIPLSSMYPVRKLPFLDF